MLATLAFVAGIGLATPEDIDLISQDATVVEDVEVIAQRRSAHVRREVDNFIMANMAPPPGRPLARWNKPVCIATAFIAPQYAQPIIDHVATRIIEFGGDVAEMGCKVDVMIIGTDNGARMARNLVRDDPRSFRPADNSTARGRRALSSFQHSEDAIRWWHVSLPVIIDTEEIAVRLRDENFAYNTVRDASRLRSNTRDDLARVVIIIDFTKTENIRTSALVDYIAFIAMAQVMPNGDTMGLNTILNMFNDPENTTGITQWDKDYLTALYRAPQNRPTIHAQSRDIATEVLREREAR